MKNLLFVLSLQLATLGLFSQDLYVPRNIQRAFDKGSRSPDGRPGPSYWQNRATYDLQVEFSPLSRLLSGTEHIVYENNSPDTLREIVFKLYPNYYKKGSPRDNKVNPDDLSDGMTIGYLKLDGAPVPETRFQTDATNMSVKILLLPGKRATFDISFSYMLNKGSHNRTGQVDEGAFFIAYFFPRIAVYDDIDGWNRYPYTGSYEFYNDFCDFDLQVMLPADYVMWATGDQTNREEIFNEKFIERIHEAENRDAMVEIIDERDLKNNIRITRGDDFNIWKFRALNVPDMVFAISNHYVWQSCSVEVDTLTHRRTRVDAVFNTAHKDYFHVLSDACKTIEAMSFRFPVWPFPYSHETVFDGLDQMEYPMMVNDNPVEDRAESIELTDHEIFHTLFPFYMGINETKYGWMDEGWATLGEWLISPMIDSSIIDDYGMRRYEANAGKELDAPIVSVTANLSGESFFLNSYPKPAMGYLFVMDWLGKELFTKALHHYMRTWAGKHPIPQDFFNCMNIGSGRNLNWFWKKWFYDEGYPDLAIADVKRKGKKHIITVLMKGEKPVPVDLHLKYENGQSERIHQPVGIWSDGKRRLKLSVSSSQHLKYVFMGDVHTPDINMKDNYFEVN